jgi:hypothetical protein
MAKRGDKHLKTTTSVMDECLDGKWFPDMFPQIYPTNFKDSRGRYV